MSLSVQKITIRNIMGIESLDISPGKITTIQGKNALGKTSVLEAIKAAFGGADATLLRNGSEVGESVIVLSDGTKIQRRFTDSGRPRATVKGPDGKKMDAPPQEYIDSLTDAFSVNPLRFVQASKKERLDAFLSALELKVPSEEIAGIVGKPANSASGNAFDAIAVAREQVYQDRTIANRLAKEKRGHVSELQRSLPAVSESDTAKELDSAERSLDAMRQAKQTRIDAARGSCQEEADSARATAEEAIANIRRSLEGKIIQLQAMLTKDIEKINAETEDGLSALNERIGALRQQAEYRAKAEATRAVIARTESDAGILEQRSQELTVMIEELDDLKSNLLSRLPIPGVELRDGDIYYDGVPFDRLNTQMQYRIGLEVANLRKKLVNAVCVDGLECLDSDNFAEFKQAASDFDLQLFVTRVCDTPLQVLTEQ